MNGMRRVNAICHWASPLLLRNFVIGKRRGPTEPWPAAGRPTVLIMTGSMGFGDVLPLCAALLDGEPRVQILALCGRNEKLLSALKENYSPDKVLPLGYTEEAGKYMDAPTYC